jgi:hypothetical protein
MNVAQETEAEFSYVGGATTRGGGNVTSLDEESGDLKYVVSPQISKRFLLRLGVEWQRFSFGVHHGTALPDELQQVSLVIGCDEQLTERWLLRAEILPGVYSDFEDVSWRDVDAPFSLAAVYLANADLQWMVALHVDVRSHYPVLPAFGVRWKFADEWTLNLMMPRPRLEWDLNDRWRVYLGADLMAGTYRVSDSFGDDHGRPGLNHAVLDYFEARVGPGLAWNVRPNVKLEANGGYMIYRRFGFFDQDRTFHSGPAPYGQIACHVQF